MTNPLLHMTPLPVFSTFKPEHVEPALDILLAKNRERIAQLLLNSECTSGQFLADMEQWDDELEQLWSPVSHLNGVSNSDTLRDVYNLCLPKLTEYATEMGQNEALYRAYKSIADSADYGKLDSAKRKSIDNALRDFRLSGVALDKSKQDRFGEIKKRLAHLATQFSNNVLDATQGWSKHVDDVALLQGIPNASIEAYRQAAVAKGLAGYIIGLDIPAYLPLMQYCDNAELREEMYRAYTTRASDQGPDAGTWDNSAAMDEILALRHELAQLLDFDNYAVYSLASKMADSPQQVEDFLLDLAWQSLPVAREDFAELEAFAQGEGVEELCAWDVPFYSEKLRLEKYAVSQEELRPYFPVSKVIEGMFAVVKRLYGIDIVEAEADLWHPDVRFYQIQRDGSLVAKFYLDLFARERKRGGAWMAECRTRRQQSGGELQLPVAYLTCNFTPPGTDLPSLLTHSEVTTLFHEFGHGLHHMLTKIDCAAVSGINGVAWDAVELPSQFLENWCWEKQAIPLISGHYLSGAALPDDLLDKMLAAKNFQSGMQMIRQLEFALFDIRMHRDYVSASPQPIQVVLDEVREQYSVTAVPEYNRFQHGFSHIFAGGYAAGYYSYKWAEVLSADAFSRFEEEGIFNAETGESFLQEILQCGGSSEPMALFVKFRGREPSVEALLRHSGITAEDVVA